MILDSTKGALRECLTVDTPVVPWRKSLLGAMIMCVLCAGVEYSV